MKLYATIAVYVHAEDILRAPGFLDKIKRAFGGKPDLRTGRVRSALEATAVVEAARDALRRIGVTNGVSLVIDGTVLFHDREGNPDDLGDLFIAFHDNESVFGQGFKELRLAVEHQEAGIRTIVEIQARSEHPREAAAARVIVSGRVEALSPRPGETAEQYRARAEPVATDGKALEVYKLQFTSQVDRIREALASAMPTARVEIEVAEPRVVRPGTEPARQPQPEERGYDPFDYYYPSPLGMVANAFMWSAVFSMAMPPHVVVVDGANHVQGHADDPGIADGPTSSDTSSAANGDSWWDANASEAPADTANVSEPASDGGSWWDGFDGGGDGGGFDGGGFDGGGFD
ncbi:MAG: hypothetical protein AB7O24_15435 [Kofleriaceae bacterium]